MRRKRYPLALVTLTLLTAMLVTIGFVPVAAADEPPVFGMSATAVRAGEVVKLTEIDSCPAPVGPYSWSQSVSVIFTDAMGKVSQWSTYTDQQGHWQNPIVMIPPYMQVQLSESPTYLDGAAPGPGVIQVKCVENDATTMEYESQTLTINGPSAGFTVSPETLKVGKPAHIESVLPCPAGSVSVDGLMYSANLDTYYYQTAVDANREWAIDFTVPAYFPQGYVLFSAVCYQSNGEPTQVYGEAYAMVNLDKFNYLAWGDSYTSGEGVEPFETGTGGEAGCHRSVNAYPRLLEQNTAMNLELGDNFVACSGATTSAITLGYNGEDAQLDTVTSDTDLITMTIGGNNMPFGDFATACVMPGPESCDETPYQEAIAGIVNNVIPRMEYMLGTVRDRLITLGNSDATVLVIGYPQVVPATWVSTSAGCWWLQPQELPAIREVTESLNTAIKNEVEAVGYDFHFVSATDSGSPFIGHELCRNTSDTVPSYLNNYDSGAPEVYTFHPNEQGQQAYADLIQAYLAQHPLN